ncbi:phospholipid carrier-dependent glycosyltransferase [Nocardia terpenica]|nr:phospholipid carrier-dependent glycosyltransferase [Nocardia terpenica]
MGGVTSTVVERAAVPVAASAVGRGYGRRVSLVVLLAGTAVLYLWDLGAAGWANQFYAAAVQAGSVSWKAMLFGSSDGANAITVDKTPGALWVMDLSARLFGFNAWSLLVPQALAGVAAVGVLYAAVRRVAGHGAGLLAGAALALTPVAALMFRYNNPDALLVLLLTAAAYCVLRAIEKDCAAWWLPLAGAAVGFAFLAKMMQAFLVLPAFVVVYLLAAHGPWRTRIVRSVVAVGALVVSAGWYLALVALWPADARPYIGGSQHNSVLELALGYNGVGRLTGNETGGLGNTNFDAGWDRLFGDQMGGQIAWLLPAAVILAAAGLWVLRRAPRTDAVRAALLLWLGWLLVTGVVFSFAGGIVHPYYTVALAPAIGGAVGIGAALMWRRRNDIRASAVLAGTLAITVALAWVLLRRTPDWTPWLAPAVVVVGVVATVLLLIIGRLPEVLAAAATALALTAALAGPTAYSLVTVSSTHGGAIPSAGPPGSGFPGHFRPGNGMHGRPGAPGGRHPGIGNGWNAAAFAAMLGAGKAGPNVVAALENNASGYTWVAATVGSNNAATYQLATREPVLAVGGYNGTDPSPTLEQFEAAVAQHKIHYFIDSPMMGARRGTSSGGSRAAAEISAWVRANFVARTVDGVTVYDLTGTG